MINFISARKSRRHWRANGGMGYVANNTLTPGFASEEPGSEMGLDYFGARYLARAIGYFDEVGKQVCQ